MRTNYTFGGRPFGRTAKSKCYIFSMSASKDGIVAHTPGMLHAASDTEAGVIATATAKKRWPEELGYGDHRVMVVEVTKFLEESGWRRR